MKERAGGRLFLGLRLGRKRPFSGRDKMAKTIDTGGSKLRANCGVENGSE